MVDDGKTQYSQEFIDWARSLAMSKRAREALEIMIVHGSVTTEDLSERFGLRHPPRALGDLKDAGVVFTRRFVRSGAQKRIAEYTLQDVINPNIEAPRKPIPKRVKDELLEKDGPVCRACGGRFKPTVLQVDHRVPFRIGGDPDEWNQDTVMLLCQSDNRAKSWTCEHCPNWKLRDRSVCQTCYWSHPDGDYRHIAMEQQRRLTIVWQGDETDTYEELNKRASVLEESLQQYIKELLA